MSQIALDLPLPPRRAARALREQVRERLSERQFEVGSPFPSYSDLSKQSGLSRATVRRALSGLFREGWIEERSGIGTFVGPRAALPIPLDNTAADSPSIVVKGARAAKTEKVVRVAVLVYGLGAGNQDWYSTPVVAGLDSSASELALSVEILGESEGRADVLARRLMLSRPDVLACVLPTLRHGWIIAEARRTGIPVIRAGIATPDPNIPSVGEDGVQGAELAVRHLVEQGHRRIGMLHAMGLSPNIWERRLGYLNGLKSAGIKPDENLILWLPDTFWSNDHRIATMKAYLEEARPTALLCAYGFMLDGLPTAANALGLSIPRDLSIVTFDQWSETKGFLHGVKPTTIELPLREMGRALGKMARDTADGKPVAANVTLPCTLTQGASVALPSLWPSK